MRKPRERNIEASCCRRAEKRGWWHRKFKSPGKRSAPDRIFAKAMPKCPTCGCTSIVLFGEIKRPGKDATDLQLLEHEAMREAGLVVEVFDDPDDLDVALALLDSRAGRSVFD